MHSKKLFILLLTALAVGIAAAGCTPGGPCEITGNESLTVYRLPDPASDVFGILPAGETHEVLAYTASGFVGFDPGIAQAGNIGLAHHRWILLNASLSPFCLAEVPMVTLGDVEQDLAASYHNPADLVITNVNLPSTQIEENVYTPVEVTVENQGVEPSTGYEIFVFPHYDKDPQIPAGQDIIPDLAPGDSHTFTFTPGVVYSSPGYYFLRVLVTDNWNSAYGGPDSTGTNGDIEDVEIHVYQGLCNPFEEMEVSLMVMNLPSDTRILPVYVKVEGGDGIFPGTDPEVMNGKPLYEYQAQLGKIASYQCGLQGFPDRLYCLFDIPEGMEGTAQSFELRLNDCPDSVFSQANVLIPEPLEPSAGDDSGPSVPTCKADLKDPDCTAAGGKMSDSTTTAPRCVCP